MRKKNILNKVAFSLNGFLFLMGGIVVIGDNKLVLGILQLLASILNISMIVKMRSEKTSEKLNYAILVMNVIICMSISIDYMLANTSYIQFVWLIAAILSSIALILQIKRTKIKNS